MFIQRFSAMFKRFRQAAGSRPRTRRAVQPNLRVEVLEERALLSTWFVVPANQADGVTRFADLQSALDHALVAGDTVQIEPHASPGTGSISHPITLQGDPAVGPGALTQLGTLQFNGGGIKVRDLNLNNVEVMNGSTGNTIENCLAHAIVEDSGAMPVGSNRILGNTITGILDFGNPDGPAASQDQIIDNDFPNSIINAPIFVQHENNLLVQGNTFTSQTTNHSAIFLSDGQNDMVSGNRISFSPGGMFDSGIVVICANSDSSYVLVGNSISTASGDGIAVGKNSTAHTLNVSIAGNDLTQNGTGLSVMPDTSGALPTVDAGGGGSGGGGNDFHGYVPGGGQAIATGGTIGTVQAQFNIWSVADPTTVINPVASPHINVANPLNADRAFVQMLYVTYLHRAGTLAELDSWVSALPGLGKSGVASTIIHSAEADSRLVEGVYLKLLGRRADAGGEAGWVAAMRGGLTAEQVIATIMAAPEFASRANQLVGTDTSTAAGNFVQAVYALLLGRTASGNEASPWVNALPQLGRSGVAAAFLGSGEFRSDLVLSLYKGLGSLPGTTLFALVPDMLHRHMAPGGGEISGWANSTLDFLSIEIQLAASSEYLQDG
jgi:hypothetical protein